MSHRLRFGTSAIQGAGSFGLLLGVVVCVGCSNEPKRFEVNGNVTLKGKPVDEAIIDFMPVSTSGGIKQGALIRDGKYSIPKEQGLPPGEYKVTIIKGD